MGKSAQGWFLPGAMHFPLDLQPPLRSSAALAAWRFQNFGFVSVIPASRYFEAASLA
jgi:hypothetical protein